MLFDKENVALDPDDNVFTTIFTLGIFSVFNIVKFPWIIVSPDISNI